MRLKLLHAIGLTNLSDDEVIKYYEVGREALPHNLFLKAKLYLMSIGSNAGSPRPNVLSVERLRTFLRVSASVIMCLVGVVVVQEAVATAGGTLGVMQSIGIALIIAGTVSALRESLLAPLAKADTQSKFDDLSLEIANVVRELRDNEQKTHTLLECDNTGMKIISNERLGFAGYHKWRLETDALEMFFAGRSVLHRIEKDFIGRNLGSVQEAFINHMRFGSNLRILFLKPTWSLIDQIASQEGRANSRALYKDIRTSLSIVKSIWDLLKQQTSPLPGSINVRLYDSFLQYAFHRIQKVKENEIEMLVGFYFTDMLGWQSALFEVTDRNTQSLFERHFSLIFDRSMEVLTYPRGGGGLERFDQLYFETAMYHIESKMEDHSSNRYSGNNWKRG